MKKELFNFDLLFSNSGGDIDFIEQMMFLFIENTPLQVQRIKQGLADKSYDEIRFASHKLLSSVEILKAESLIGLVREIEKLAFEKQNFIVIASKTGLLEKNLTIVIQEMKQLDFRNL